ncbi:hypothetical protein QBC40DRAFT_291440 [Triangularia verruculosa]|uniref:Uncharacterized protein n=1 Tax=Triangularia verruculosa TaxID=2587418 RepID=A0AAN6X4U6_9PEZI|nr:hypothetical protein QBC40DRAFT_291440 [Triangularia verruculosa]
MYLSHFFLLSALTGFTIATPITFDTSTQSATKREITRRDCPYQEEPSPLCGLFPGLPFSCPSKNRCEVCHGSNPNCQLCHEGGNPKDAGETFAACVACEVSCKAWRCC